MRCSRGRAASSSAAGALVSFNGKSFDAPMLETRYLFHRLPWPAGGLAHVDALHPSRHFWGEAGGLLADRPRIPGARRAPDRRRLGNGNPGQVFPVSPDRQRAAARGRPRTQPARPALARRPHQPSAGAAGGRAIDGRSCEGGARPRPHLSALRVERPRARGIRSRARAGIPRMVRGSRRRAARARAQRPACAPVRGRGSSLAGPRRDARLPAAPAASGRGSARDSPRASRQGFAGGACVRAEEPGESGRLRPGAMPFAGG